MTGLTRLRLSDFRSYESLDLEVAGRAAWLVGPNGAGKTNLLEAISLLTPGKGLRGASLTEVGRRAPGEAVGRAWAVSAVLTDDAGEETRLGTGVEQPGASRRLVRIDGQTTPPGRLVRHQRQVWLTPAHDRLFLEAAAERRRFYDRLVFAQSPHHAVHGAEYDKALRERLRLLTEGPDDPTWLAALEARLAQSGALVAEGRARTLQALQAEVDSRGDRPFPQARLLLTGEFEQMALDGAAAAEIAPRLAEALAESRRRDAAARRSLRGPHRCDLDMIHRDKDRPAAECSTGEQKALLLNLVLAQAARLSRAESAPNPILLLDEVAAHLDRRRRAALFDEIVALELQAFLTGTDEHLFEDLKGRALGLRIDASGPAILDAQ